MNEREIRGLIEKLRGGRLTRRGFVQRLALHGLGLPVAWTLLADAGIAQTNTLPPYKPTRRGGGGALRMLYWQGPTQLNPHFATGTKDNEAANLFYESLARWDADANLLPVLAEEIPSRENGGVAADGRSVVWKLKRGVTWHDGTPFTADDVIFNWRYARDPATGATTSGAFLDLGFEKIDAHSFRVVFDRPTPFWPRTYTAILLVPRHVFEPFAGSRSREAAANFRPVGTGPYRFVDFRPGDLLRAVINPAYHRPNRPHFDSVEIKGGGDATSAARAVLQAGEYDWAWNLQVEDELLKRLENGGKGRVVVTPGGSLEFIECNTTDPWTDVDGDRSHLSTKHPVWQHAAVRRAFAHLIDRQGIQDVVYGRLGSPTANIINNPARFRSPANRWEFSIDKAAALLDAEGWTRGADGVRAKNGVRLKLVFQTSVNSARQKVQSIVKSACQKAGIELELKSISAAVYFSGDQANPDTNQKFHADLQMYQFTMGPPDPQRFMDRYASWEASGRHNRWQGRNIMRWRNPEYDRLYREAEGELDPVKRAALFVRMNDLVVSDFYMHPLLFRPSVAGASRRLVAMTSGWTNDTTWIADWFRE